MDLIIIYSIRNKLFWEKFMMCELKEILIKKEKELFYNKVIIIDVANLILTCGGLKGYIILMRKLKKYKTQTIFCLANASTKSHLSSNELKKYQNFVEKGEIKVCPPDCENEEFLIQIGINIPGSLILTCNSLGDYEFNIISHLNIIKFIIIGSSIYFNLNLKLEGNDKTKLINENEVTWLDILYNSDNAGKSFKIYEKNKNYISKVKKK